MSFYSIGFVLFFPFVVLVYYAMPKKYQNGWLLIGSYFFYACWSVKHTVILFLVTMLTYISARAMQGKWKKLVLSGCLIANLSVLLFLKYGQYGAGILGKIFHYDAQISIAVPIGLSFYMLQALGYVIDVYRQKTVPEKNFVRYALFVSFFPTILSGPIERSTHLLKQIQEGTSFSYAKAKRGLILIVYGFFEKVLIADRIAAIVDYTYENHMEYSGVTILFVVILYAIQIYTDFAGYSNMAFGIAQVFGFEVIINFKQPYFALNIRDFWKRWHISLSKWLQDYVYIPLGGNRKGKVRTYCNLMLTFLVSGMWHGNGFKYFVWGGLHGIYQVAGRITEKSRNTVKGKLHINTDCWSYRLFQRVITFAMVDFAWIFFSAGSFFDAIELIRKIFFRFNLLGAIYVKEYLLLGMEESRWVLLFLYIAVVGIIDKLHEEKISILAWFEKQNVLFRWGVYLMGVLVILIGTLYNFGTESASFIYTRF